jgi:predicted permease
MGVGLVWKAPGSLANYSHRVAIHRKAKYQMQWEVVEANMPALYSDLAYALRQLITHRVYAITAIFSMALGIAATTAVYSVLYGVLIDPYPYHDASRIAMINIHDKQGEEGDIPYTLAEIQQIRKARSVADVMAQQTVTMIATGGDVVTTAKVYEFTGNGLDFLGSPAMLGRLWTAQDAPEGVAPPPVAVISFLFWKNHFSAAPDVIGKPLELNHHKYTVIGVVGPRFTWGDGDVYLPLPPDTDPKTRFGILVRIRPDVSLGAATGELDSFVRHIIHDHPEMVPPGSFQVKVESLNDTLLGQFKGTLFLLFGAVVLLLLIGCGNVSILMLARGTARQQELGMRAALGATRLRIIRQLLTEAVLLSVTGGVLGIGLAFLAIRLIVGLLPEYSIPHEVVISLNIPVLLFSAAVSVTVGIVAGLAPSLQFSRPHLNAILQAGESRTATSRGARVRSAMMVAQVGLTVLLLAGAGAAMRTFLEAYTAKLGFDPHNSLLMLMALPENSYKTWQTRSQYLDALTEKIKATPGVVDATAFNGGLPPMGEWRQKVRVVGNPANDGRQAGVMLVSADYFAVQRIPLLQGRTISRAEVLRGAHLTVVSQTFAERYFSGANPIGHMVIPADLQHPMPEGLSAPNPEEPFEIVGVVADVRNDGLHKPIQPEMYVPSTVLMFPRMSFLVRTAGNPRLAVHDIGVGLRALDQNQVITEEYAFEDFLSTFVWSHDRFISILFAVFSAVALGLAAIGLFSVVAYSVEQRTREIGIRMALGAPRLSVLILTLTSIASTTCVGLLLGIGLSIGLSDSVHKWTQSSMRDAGVLSIISAVFLLASIIACIVPARRAMQVDPMVALRSN